MKKLKVSCSMKPLGNHPGVLDAERLLAGVVVAELDFNSAYCEDNKTQVDGFDQILEDLFQVDPSILITQPLVS